MNVVMATDAVPMNGAFHREPLVQVWATDHECFVLATFTFNVESMLACQSGKLAKGFLAQDTTKPFLCQTFCCTAQHLHGVRVNV